MAGERTFQSSWSYARQLQAVATTTLDIYNPTASPQSLRDQLSSQHGHPIDNAMRLAITDLSLSGAAAVAADYLDLIAVLDPTGVPVEHYLTTFRFQAGDINLHRSFTSPLWMPVRTPGTAQYPPILRARLQSGAAFNVRFTTRCVLSICGFETGPSGGGKTVYTT